MGHGIARCQHGLAPLRRFAHALGQAVDGLADREIEHLAVERGVVAGLGTEAEHLAAVERVLAATLRGEDDARGVHVDDADRDLRVGDLALARAEDPEQLRVAGDLAAELADRAGDGEVRALERLGLALQPRLAGRLLEVVAVHQVEATRLLQVRHQDGLGLAAEAIDAVGEHAAQVRRAVVELADDQRAARPVVGLRRGRGDGLLRCDGLMRLGGGATCDERGRADQHEACKVTNAHWDPSM